MKSSTGLRSVREALCILFAVVTFLTPQVTDGADLDVHRNYEGSLFKMTENNLFGIEFKLLEEESGQGGKKAELILYDSSGNDVENAEITVIPGPGISVRPLIVDKGGGFYGIDHIAPEEKIEIRVKKEGVEDTVIFHVPQEKVVDAEEDTSPKEQKKKITAEEQDKPAAAGAGIDYRTILKPLPALPPIPPDNTLNAEKIRLGKMLFWERRASRSGTTSCASCHHPSYYGAEPLEKSVGIGSEIYQRNAPTVLNAAFKKHLFWAGEAQSLEDRGLHSVKAHMDMHNLPEEVTEALNRIAGYRQLSEHVFGGPLTEGNIRKAIAAFIRTLITPDYPLARWLHGDESALTESQKKGMALFIDKGCIGCHSGAGFSGPADDREIRVHAHEHNEEQPPGLHKVVLPDAENDAGLANKTKKQEDKYLFRVQQLLNVAMTPPYSHTGRIDSLPAMVDFMARAMLHTELSLPEIEEIAAFLQSLTGEIPREFMSVPLLPADDRPAGLLSSGTEQTHIDMKLR